jgi:transposase-like protein
VYRHVQRSQEALDAPRLQLEGSVELNELHVKAGFKRCERDRRLRSRDLLTCGRRKYSEDKPPVFVLVDRGTKEYYVLPARPKQELIIRPLLTDHDGESLTVYTDGFSA